MGIGTRITLEVGGRMVDMTFSEYPSLDVCPECGGAMEPDPDKWHEGVYRCTERDCDFTETR